MVQQMCCAMLGPFFFESYRLLDDPIGYSELSSLLLAGLEETEREQLKLTLHCC